MPTPSGYGNQPEDSKTPVDDGNVIETEFDENGYEKAKVETSSEQDDNGAGKDTSEPDVDTKEDDKVQKPATGYGDDPEEDDDKSKKSEDDKTKTDDEKKDDSKEEQKDLNEEEVKSALGELPDGYDKDSISKFALDNKLTKEQIEAYVEYSKNETEELKKSQAAQVKAQRDSWKKELTTDTEFGGENFDKNVDRVEKVLEKFMPDTKKVLTERGTMLPPYIMRDLLKVSKALNPTTKLVNGDPSKSVEKEGNFLDEMYE